MSRNTGESGISILNKAEAWEFDNRINPPRHGYSYLNPDDGYDRLRDFGYVKTGVRREYKDRERVNIGWTRKY